MNFNMDLFIEKIDKILNSLSTIEKEKDEIKGNLIASFYMELIAIFSSNPKYKDLLLEMSQQDPKTTEEYNKAFEYSTNKIKELGLNPSDELTQAGQKVLNNFIKELELKLPQEKVIELKKIISE
ncbi:MAG: hypothetical protein AAB437_05045 [Patescibacteria group bacterium]